MDPKLINKAIKNASLKIKLASHSNAKNILLSYYSKRRTANVVYKEALFYLQAAPNGFFENLSKNIGIRLVDLVNLFKNWKVVKFFNSIKWNFETLLDLLKNGYNAAKELKDILKEYIENNKVVRWTTQELHKFDEFLKNHPKTRRIIGLGLAALMTYIWFQMSYTGNPKFDFDTDEIFQSLHGSFSLENLFGGANGIALISLLLTGSFLSFPWPGSITIHFIGGIIFTLAKKFKVRMEKTSSKDKIILEDGVYYMMSGKNKIPIDIDAPAAFKI